MPNRPRILGVDDNPRNLMFRTVLALAACLAVLPAPGACQDVPNLPPEPVEAAPQPAPEPAEAAPDAPQVSWSATYASRYSFQGFDYSDGRPVLQPEVTGTLGALSVSLWGNLDQGRGELNEVDGTLRLGWTVGGVSAAAGYANLQYPNRPGWSPSQELFTEIEAGATLAPSLALHWDVDAGHGLYGALGLGAERALGGVAWGLATRLYAQHRYYGTSGISGLETSAGAGLSWRDLAWRAELARLWTWENGGFSAAQAIPGGWLFRLTLSSE
jgi:hypothetical protein